MAEEKKEEKPENPKPTPEVRGSRVDRFEESEKKETRTIPNKGN